MQQDSTVFDDLRSGSRMDFVQTKTHEYLHHEQYKPKHDLVIERGCFKRLGLPGQSGVEDILIGARTGLQWKAENAEASCKLWREFLHPDRTNLRRAFNCTTFSDCSKDQRCY